MRWSSPPNGMNSKSSISNAPAKPSATRFCSTEEISLIQRRWREWVSFTKALAAENWIIGVMEEKRAHLALQHSDTPPLGVVDVAAALIFREGKLLITQRPAGAHL